MSLNGYNKVDTCTDVCNKAQMEWLKKDLAAVDRSKTPWVVAMSHFPMCLPPANKCLDLYNSHYVLTEIYHISEYGATESRDVSP